MHFIDLCYYGQGSSLPKRKEQSDNQNQAPLLSEASEFDSICAETRETSKIKFGCKLFAQPTRRNCPVLFTY
jgi:hypothetical protein